MGNSHSKTQLKTAVEEGRWSDAFSLLVDSNYSNSAVEHFMKYCGKYGVDGEFSLSDINNEKGDILLTTAVRVRQWKVVHHLLQAGVSHERRVWVIKQACETANFSQVLFFILPQVTDDFLSQCSTEQLDTLLTTATTRGLWHMVHKVLKVVDSHEKRVWVIEQACETANDWDLEEYIQPHVDEYFLSQCNTEQLEKLLTSQVKSSQKVTKSNGRWYVVNMLLRAGGSHSQRIHIIEHVCKTDDFWDFQNFMLDYVDGDFLSLCSTEQLETLLSTATTRGLWYLVHKLLEVVDSHEMCVWVIEQAGKTANSSQFLLFILPHLNDVFLSHCSTTQLVTLMTTATKHGVWHNVLHKVLKAGVSHENREWVLEQAYKEHMQQYVEGPYDDEELLALCNTDQMNTLLTTQRRWYIVNMLCGSHSQRLQIIERVSKTAEFADFQKFILEYVDDDFLSHCSTEELGIFLTTATTRGLWHIVHKLFETLNSPEKRVWVIEKACETASYKTFENYILPHVDSDFLSHCSTEQLDTFLTKATLRGLWHMVHKLLETVNSHEKRVWVIGQACKTADYKKYKDILPHVDSDFLSQCSTQHLWNLLTTATANGRWWVVKMLLSAGGSHSQRIQIIEHACKTADYTDFQKFILEYVDEDFLSHCSTEQVDSMLTTATTRVLWQMVHKMLKVGVSHEKRIWVIEQACKTAEYSHFDYYILSYVDNDFLSHCDTQQLDTLLITATIRGLWSMVCKVLKVVENHEQRVWVIDQACKTAEYDDFDHYILPYVDNDLSHCNTQQLDTLLITATTRGLRYMVCALLETVDSHRQRVWAIEEACKTASYKDFEAYILPQVNDDFLSQCTTDQLDTFLTKASTRGLWHMVHKLLKVGVSHEKRVWVIEKACETASYKTFEDYILPHVDSGFLSHCSREELDTLLKTATTGFIWQMVHKVSKAGVSHEKYVWVIEQACNSAHRLDLETYILPYVDDDFLSQCSTDQLDTLLTTATMKGLWYVVDTLFHASASHSLRVHVIEQACKKVNFSDCRNFILEYVDCDLLCHCNTEQLDTLLTTATTRGLWHVVHKVLKVVDSHEKRVWVIEQACETANDWDLEEYIQPHVDEYFLSKCSTEQLDNLLTSQVKSSQKVTKSNGRWYVVNMLLRAGGSHSQRKHIIEHVCKTDDFWEFHNFILDYVDGDFLSLCSTGQLETLLTKVTTRGLWYLVHKLLEVVDSHEMRVWVIDQACKTANSSQFMFFILPHFDYVFLSHCSTVQLDTLLTTATTHGVWHMVDKVLTAGGSHESRARVIETAGKTANNLDFREYVFPHIDDDFLTTATRQGLWPVLHKVLNVTSSHKKCELIIKEACETAAYVDFRQYILQYVDSDFLSHCNAETIDTLLTTATMRGLWHMVQKVLKVVVSHEKRVWVIEEACETASYRDFRLYILQHVDSDFLSQCNAQTLDTLLTTATIGGLWHMVHKVMEAVGSHEKGVWVIKQACESADFRDLINYILPHVHGDFLSQCTAEQFETLLTTATTRGLWHMVQKLLKVVDCHAWRVEVIKQACKTADFSQVEIFILPHVHDDFLSLCSTEQLDTFLTTATTRGLWHMVQKMLKVGVSRQKRVWVIEEACKTADFSQVELFILPQVNDDYLSVCSTEQLDTLLKTATTQGLWCIVLKVLKAAFNCEKHARFIEEACKTSGFKEYFILELVADDFLFQCNPELLDILLTTATTQCFWQMVHKLLKAGVSHEKYVWVIEQACNSTHRIDLETYILPYVDEVFLSQCSTDQLDTLLTTATMKGLWYVVDTLFHASASHSQRVRVIEQACKKVHFSDCRNFILDYVDDDLLSNCSTEQLETLLTTATTRGLWHMVNKVFKAVTNHEKHFWVTEQACKTAELIDFENYILPHVDDDFLSHCSTGQLDTLLTTATTRGLWHMVHKLLKVFLIHEKRVWVIEQACKTADFSQFELFILPQVNDDFLSQCTTEKLDTLLTTATPRGFWQMVHKLLKAGVSHEKYVWIIEQACNSAHRIDLETYILPYVDDGFLSLCSTDQLDTLLTTATMKGLWYVVDALFHASASHSQRVRVIEQACKKVNFSDCGNFILDYVDDDLLSNCSTEQLETLLTTATTRGLWHMVNKVLKVVDSHEKCVWVIEQACNTTEHRNVEDCILPHVENDLFMSHCSTEQLDIVLTTVTTNGLWYVVNMLLRAGGSQSQRIQIVKQACKTADVRDFEENILQYIDDDFLSHCSTEQLDTLLTTARKQGLWHMVHKLLKNFGSHEKRAWVIEQASKTAYKDFEECILPQIDDDFLSHCTTEQLDILLTTATKWRVWQMVHTLLKAGFSHEKNVWVIKKACETAEYKDFEHYILPHVDDDFLSECNTQQLNQLLTTATSRGLWHMVYEVLKVDSHQLRVRVIEQACKTAVSRHFEDYIMPYVDDSFLSQCSSEQLDTFLTTATTRGLWHMVHKLLKAGASLQKRVWVIEHACKTSGYRDFQDYILPHVDDDFLSQCKGEQLNIFPRVNNFHFLTYLLICVDGDFLTTATIRGFWHMVHKVLKTTNINHKKRAWVIQQACKTADYKDFEDYILPHFDVDFLSHCSAEQLDTLLTGGFQAKMYGDGLSAQSRLWVLSEACKCFTYTTVMKRINIAFGISNVRLLISSLTSNQLPPDAQSVALRLALQEHRWDVISRASLSQVWEQVRRHLFREAVYQKQWTLVKKWADHTLYDDERWWAQEESYKQKQWDVMLRLADHGLTEIELMRVRYRLAKHADWDVVLQMFERGVDVTEVREMVETVMLSRKAKADKEKHCALVDRWWQLRQLEEKLIHASATRITLPSTASQWESVLFHLHRHPGTVGVRSRSQPSKTFGGLLLQRAIKQRAWHLVMHLVRLGLDTDQLDSLLTDMIRRRQWGVCRVLLEQGVSVQSCLRSLFVFMEMNQWMLVARVMEFIVDDSLKHQVEKLALERCVGSLVWQCVSAMCRVGMCVGDALRLYVIQHAIERREGSVVGECISTMEHYRLSAKEREELFQQAISRGVLQAVKPLVEEKDETEIQHRDTVLLAAIEQRQWDVVDCCQLQGADIDMKDEHGETPLIREVRNVEWKAVEELVVRGADPNVLDRFDYSVLNRAIEAKQWDIVRLLIEYHGDIHKAAPLKPLNMLIDERQGEIINHTLIWCPDQAKGVSDKGETTLHAIALDERPEKPFYYQIVRGVSPLTLTKEGHSVLLYAVGNDHCPQKMVAECIRLGFSTHQPRPSALTAVDLIEYVTDGLLNGWKMHGYYGMFTYRRITSPFLLAVLRGMPAVAHMLYESGSCSSTELQRLYTMLLDLLDPRTEAGRTLLEGEHVYGLGSETFNKYQEEYTAFVEYITTFLPYLSEMASTPRSLVSTCRLVISHSITVHKRHERDVQDLFRTDRMKNYLLFSDLTDPDYQPYMYGRCHHTELKNRKELELETWMKKTYDKILKELEGTDPSH